MRDEVSVDPVQVAAAQTVPAECCRQAPAPSQAPSLPQVDASEVGHCEVRTGGIPAAIVVHVPDVPARLHETQTSPHATLQHTP